MVDKKVSKKGLRMMARGPEQKEVAKDTSLMRLALPSVFFLTYFLYVLLVVESTLIYHSLGRTLLYPAFRTSFRFFAQSMGTCGGPVEYLAALISHLFYSNWTGALIYTFIGFSLWLSTRGILATSKTGGLGFLSYLPAVALLVIGTGYNHQPVIVLSITLGLLFFTGYMKARSNAPLRAAMLLIVLSAALFYLSVSGCLLFWCMAALYELLVERSFSSAGIAVAIGGAMSLIAVFLFGIDMHPLRWELSRVVFASSSIKPDPYPLAVIQGLYFFFPVLLIASGLLAGRTTGDEARSKKKLRTVIPWLSLSIQVATLVIMCLALLKPAFDVNQKQAAKVGVFARERQWAQLLDYVEQSPFSENMTLLNAHDIITALYHTDTLAENLFDWPMALRCLTLPKDIVGLYGDQLVRRSNFVLEMGSLGLGEKFAYEALVNYGEQADILENLAIINMVKGDIQTARVYLNILTEDLNYSDRGRYWLDILTEDPTLENNNRINHLRSLVLKTAETYGLNLTLNYEPLLLQNSENKAAKEFMMTQFLLAGQLDVFVTNLNQYNTFPGGKLPRSYDQALAFYRVTGGRAPCQWEPSFESSQQARKFLGLVKQYKGNTKLVYRATKQEFGKSYCFYYLIYRTGA